MNLQFNDIFELLEVVRLHELSPGESIAPFLSEKSTHVGYSIVDSSVPSISWAISIVDLKNSCGYRTSEEAVMVRQKMRSYQDCASLMKDLRSGVLRLERPDISVVSAHEPEQISPKISEAEAFMDSMFGNP